MTTISIVDGLGYHDDGDYEESDNAIELDPKVLKRELQHRNLYDQLSKYYQEIDDVRKTHSAMKAQLMNLSNLHNGNVSKDDHPQQQHNNDTIMITSFNWQREEANKDAA